MKKLLLSLALLLGTVQAYSFSFTQIEDESIIESEKKVALVNRSNKLIALYTLMGDRLVKSKPSPGEISNLEDALVLRTGKQISEIPLIISYTDKNGSKKSTYLVKNGK